jgi:hypothetical protein
MKVLYKCPHCGRWFDSPSVCMPSGAQTVPVTFPPKEPSA